ncbi:MAG: Holliday junction branch migration protein RuvA [bacterium]
MISYLQGKIIDKNVGRLIVLVNNIGYKVFVTSDLSNKAKKDQEIKLYTYQHVKEDGISLFGFSNKDELEIFELLISVSGIGPKSGLNVLLIASVDDIKQAIIINDSDLLTKVSGIGKKTAERIVLELRNKVGSLSDAHQSGISLASEEIDALMQLGYSLGQARQALQRVDPSITDSGGRIKQALKFIA